ncbi:MAG: helix-turn-helix domain-containing protein [Burkholderiales bacterium]
MTASTVLVTNNSQQTEDIFSDLEPISAVEIKKDYLATQLAALMSFSGKNRSDMAEGLGWKKSRITRVLSGNENLTIKTIWEFSSYLGFDFDVIFHGPNDQRPKQPWQIEQSGIIPIHGMDLKMFDEHFTWIPSFIVNIQSSSDVESDLRTGNHKNFDLNVTYSNDVTADTIPVLDNLLRANPDSLGKPDLLVPITNLELA